MTSTLLTLLFAATAILVALALAFVPLRLLVFGMARSVRGTVSDWVQRQRGDRRSTSRETPERRKAPPPYVAEKQPDVPERRDDDRRGGDRRDTERRDDLPATK